MGKHKNGQLHPKLHFPNVLKKGQRKEEYAKDPIDGAMARIEANYHSGLIDHGKYLTQLNKLKTMKNMRFAEKYNNLLLDRDNLNYYKLKYAAQLSDSNYRTAFNFYDNEKKTKEGALYGIYRSPVIDLNRNRIL